MNNSILHLLDFKTWKETISQKKRELEDYNKTNIEQNKIDLEKHNRTK